MSYTPKSWGMDDIIQSADLDHMETQFDEAYSYFLAHDHDTRYYTRTAMQSTFWYAGNDGGGSGSDADLIYKASGNLHAAAFGGLGLSPGLIIWWEEAQIPDGWHICNGQAGTRDLRDRFVVGAGTGSGYSVGDTGGSATFTASGTITINPHALTVAEMGQHRHPFTDSQPVFGNVVSISTIETCIGTTTHNGTTSTAGSGAGHGHSSAEGTAINLNAVNSLPFCYALYAIQKL